MHKRTVLAGYASIFLLLAMLGALSIMPVRAAKTWTVDDDGPADFQKIQDAINAASPGDTIFVYDGTYYENVVVDKSLALIGNCSSTTIIDGNATGYVVRIDAPDVNITGFTIQNAGDDPYRCIYLASCVRNTICYNVIRNSAFGIELHRSNNCIIFGNKIMNNSGEGIQVVDSSNNVIHYNLIVNNLWGVFITSDSSLFNLFYHNNFINNLNHANDFALTTKWNNNAEGNYWSDYEGKDLDGDGIGETLLPYRVPIFGEDNFPLMEPWSPYRVFNVTINGVTHHVSTFSNSTLASFNFNQPLKQISFNVTSGASGFCKVTIPKTLLNVSASEKWKVIIDGRLLTTGERTVTGNATHTSLYFTYTAGIHKVKITTVSSTISIVISSASITLGSSATISGNIAAKDPINPLRPNATVTVQSRPIGAVTWRTIGTVETDLNSNYTYIWTPETGGMHEVMTRWEGDEETVGNESDVLVLTVLYVFEPEGVYIETNSTASEFNSISAFDFNQPLKQISFNVISLYGTVGFCNVTIPKALLPSPALQIGWKVLINGTLLSVEEIVVPENATHTFVYFTYSKGVNTVQITTRMSSTISMALSSDSTGLGSSVTIIGNVTAADNTVRADANVTIQYKSSGDVEWTTLAMVKTDSNGVYSYDWTPETTGTYEVMARWEGDEICIGNQSDVWTLTVKWSSIISIALSEDSIHLGEGVIISGSITVADNIARADVNVTILYRLSGTTSWNTLTTVKTDESGNYTYDWEPKTTGTYEVKASWLGDNTTVGDESDVWTLKVEKASAGIPLEIVVAAVVAIIIIAAIVAAVVYFVKIRKP